MYFFNLSDFELFKDEVIDDRISEQQDLVETEQIEPVQEPESNVDLLSEEFKATSLENVWLEIQIRFGNIYGI